MYLTYELLDCLFEMLLGSIDLIQKDVLILWFHFDPGHKLFYRPYENDYPLVNELLSKIIAKTYILVWTCDHFKLLLKLHLIMYPYAPYLISSSQTAFSFDVESGQTKWKKKRSG